MPRESGTTCVTEGSSNRIGLSGAQSHISKSAIKLHSSGQALRQTVCSCRQTRLSVLVIATAEVGVRGKNTHRKIGVCSTRTS